MNTKRIVDFRINESAEGFFMVREATVKTGKNGKQYLDVLISDKTGEIAAKKWDIYSDGEDAEVYYRSLKQGDFVKVLGMVSEWNGIKQFTLKVIEPVKASDDFDPADFVKVAPEDAKEMYDFIYESARALTDPKLRALCTKVLEDNREQLQYWPAASRNHHAIMGGLLYHTKRMLQTGKKICEVYDILNSDLVVAGVILHDIQKINEIMSNKYGVSEGYSFEGMMLGHIVLGVRELDKMMDALEFDYETKIMIEHMILSHHYEPEFGSPKKPLFPEAEILHYLDMIDARMYDMEEALEAVDGGEFSERIWSMDNRRIYKKI